MDWMARLALCSAVLEAYDADGAGEAAAGYWGGREGVGHGWCGSVRLRTNQDRVDVVQLVPRQQKITDGHGDWGRIGCRVQDLHSLLVQTHDDNGVL